MVLFEVDTEVLISLRKETDTLLFFLERASDVVLFVPARWGTVFSVMQISPENFAQLSVWKATHLRGAIRVNKVLDDSFLMESSPLEFRPRFENSGDVSVDASHVGKEVKDSGE